MRNNITTNIKPINIPPTSNYRPCATNAVCRLLTPEENIAIGGGCPRCKDCFCQPGFVGDGWNECVEAVNQRPSVKSHLKILFVSPSVSVVETVSTDVAAKFRCIAIGTPTPKIRWMRKGEILKSKRMEIKPEEEYWQLEI